MGEGGEKKQGGREVGRKECTDQLLHSPIFIRSIASLVNLLTVKLLCRQRARQKKEKKGGREGRGD